MTGERVDLDPLPTELGQYRVDLVPALEVETIGSLQDVLEPWDARLIGSPLDVDGELPQLIDEPFVRAREIVRGAHLIEIARSVVDRLRRLVHPLEELLQRLRLRQPSERELDAVARVDDSSLIRRLR